MGADCDGPPVGGPTCARPLVACPDCGRHLRRAEETCPFCGRAGLVAFMQRAAVAMAFFGAAAMPGCAYGPPPDDFDTAEVAAETSEVSEVSGDASDAAVEVSDVPPEGGSDGGLDSDP